MKSITEPLLLIYLLCSNQQGDQSKTNEYSVAIKSGSIQLDVTSTGEAS